jgi:hypothetical protein
MKRFIYNEDFCGRLLSKTEVEGIALALVPDAIGYLAKDEQDRVVWNESIHQEVK